MEQEERLRYLIKFLAEERGLALPEIPAGGAGRRLLRSLMNVRPPEPVPAEFLRVQDDFLTEELARRGVVDCASLTPEPRGFCLWRGDITRLRAEAIVNAANGAMLGCFVPCHGCIDNAIHSAAGIQLRIECAELMRAQGHDEPPGRAKITRGYNLPARHVIHTVGPIVRGEPDERDAARVAVAEVEKFLTERGSSIKVIFNVFKQIDYDIYKRLLGGD